MKVTPDKAQGAVFCSRTASSNNLVVAAIRSGTRRSARDVVQRPRQATHFDDVECTRPSGRKQKVTNAKLDALTVVEQAR
jgi:hypothetical protein